LSHEAPDLEQISLKARQYIYHYDSDKNGALDFLEFSKLIFTHPELLGTAIMLRSYFVDADLNKSGNLDKYEMKQMMKSFMEDSGYPLPPQQEFDAFIDKIMKESDINKDGYIDYSEFVAFVLRKDAEIPLFQVLISHSQDILYHDPFGIY
jgi:Ca2+-binding EF-hand superfamily protein